MYQGGQTHRAVRHNTASINNCKYPNNHEAAIVIQIRSPDTSVTAKYGLHGTTKHHMNSYVCVRGVEWSRVWREENDSNEHEILWLLLGYE